MEVYEPKVLDIRDEDNEYSVSQFTQDQLGLIIEHLNYSKAKAKALAKNCIGVISNEVTMHQISNAFRHNRLNLLPQILKSISLDIIQIEKCQLLRLRQPDTDPLDDNHINWLRNKVGPNYPELIQARTLSITGTDGKRLEFQTWDLLQARKLDQIFERFQEWINQQKGQIAPQFQRINAEIGDWLSSKLEGIKPQEDGFVNWFVSNKLSTLDLEIHGTSIENPYAVLQVGYIPMRLTIKDISKQLAPNVIAEHLVEYGLWCLEKANSSFQRGQINYLDTKRALNHQSFRSDSLPPLPRINNFRQTTTPTKQFQQGERKENTQRKARQAITLFENRIEEIVSRERGKTYPLPADQITTEAIRKYSELAVARNLGADVKSLNRYLNDIGKNTTAKKYGRQLVGQFRRVK